MKSKTYKIYSEIHYEPTQEDKIYNLGQLKYNKLKYHEHHLNFPLNDLKTV